MVSIPWADSYMGQIRELAGDRVLMFIAARAVLRDDRGRVLLIQRSDNGHWALPAGAMELGESIVECAIREVREETGLHAHRVTPYAMYSGADYTFTNMWGHTYQHFVTGFRVDEWDGELQRVTDESLDAMWFDLADPPFPMPASVQRTLDDLTEFERTGNLVMK